MTISERKNDHIRVNLMQDTQSETSSGFEKYRIVHNALPENDFAHFQIDTELFGKKIQAPLLISAMTGGTAEGQEINRILLQTAQHLRVAFAIGSQRIWIESQIQEPLRVRTIAPDIPIFANIGAVQLNYGFGIDECRRAVDQIGADALVLHLNPLQEILQPEGNTNFCGLLKKIEQICKSLNVPVIVKEVGWGISPQNAHRLSEVGVAMIDIAGAGGTSWAKVEALRSVTDAAEFARPFFGWGIPTAECIHSIKAQYPDIRLIASGGIFNGVEMAKAILLGAELAGIARPLLSPAVQGIEQAEQAVLRTIGQYRAAIFCAEGIIKS